MRRKSSSSVEDRIREKAKRLLAKQTCDTCYYNSRVWVGRDSCHKQISSENYVPKKLPKERTCEHWTHPQLDVMHHNPDGSITFMNREVHEKLHKKKLI